MNKLFHLRCVHRPCRHGCTLAPKYEQPALPVAQTWTENSATNSTGNTNAVADIGWHEFFQDPRLQQLIGLALTNNRDLRVAVLNVEVAQAQYRIQRANLYPEIDGSGSIYPSTFAEISIGARRKCREQPIQPRSRHDGLRTGFVRAHPQSQGAGVGKLFCHGKPRNAPRRSRSSPPWPRNI